MFAINNNFKFNSLGFTLVELLAVIVVLAITFTIAITGVLDILKSTNKNAFQSSAKLVFKAINLKLVNDDKYNISEIDVAKVKTELEISTDNYETVLMTLNSSGKPYIVIVGKNKWEGLTVYGTADNLIIKNSDKTYPTEGLTLHLDAFSIKGLKAEEKLEVWNDLSGNGNDATQIDPLLQPIYTTAFYKTDEETLSKMTPKSSIIYESLGNNEFSSNTTYDGCHVENLIIDNNTNWVWNSNAGATLDIYFKNLEPKNITRFQLFLHNSYGTPSAIKLYKRNADNWDYVESFTPTMGWQEYIVNNNTLTSTGWLIRIEHNDWIGLSTVRVFSSIDKQSINSEFPVIRFNQQWLTTNKQWGNFGQNNEYTAFVVGKGTNITTNAATGYENQGYFGDREGYVSMYLKSSRVIGAYNWAGSSKVTEQNYDPTYFLATSQLSNGAIRLRVNGGPETSTASDNTPIMMSILDIGRIYNTQIFNGDICEILIYNRALSNIERELVEQYLGQKWLGWQN